MSLVCIFGDSHLGALAQSQKGLARLEAKGHEVFFWGIAGSNFANLRLDGGKVISPLPKQSARVSAGRYEHLDLSAPDVIVFYGFSVRPSFQARRIALTLQYLRNVSSGLKEAVRDAEIQRIWEEGIANRLIAPIIARYPEKTFIFAPQPLVAEHDEFLSRIDDLENYHDILKRLMRHYEQWMTDRGVHFIAQPDHTISNQFFTNAEFSKGSARLVSAETHEEADVKHMNPDYGEIMLKRIGDLLEG